ncbi:MAG: transglycosylase SLT domain-containing protein [bacterium]
MVKLDTKYTINNPYLLSHKTEAGLYWDIILEASQRYNLQPSIIAGLGSRESKWGLALKPPGPAGTGDCAERKFPTKLRKGPLPPDGMGFGRGLMQIDWDAHLFARTGNWRDPRENIFYGCKVLTDCLAYIRKNISAANERGFEDQDFLQMALAAYNCGPSRMLKAIQTGEGIDFYTTGKNYSENVLDRAGWFQNHGWA